MERKKASDYPQELLNLFDYYVHGEIDRRTFLTAGLLSIPSLDLDSAARCRISVAARYPCGAVQPRWNVDSTARIAASPPVSIAASSPCC